MLPPRKVVSVVVPIMALRFPDLRQVVGWMGRYWSVDWPVALPVLMLVGDLV